jgi:hypothetical protein
MQAYEARSTRHIEILLEDDTGLDVINPHKCPRELSLRWGGRTLLLHSPHAALAGCVTSQVSTLRPYGNRLVGTSTRQSSIW